MFKQGMETAYRDAEIIIRKAIKEVLPDKAVRSVLGNRKNMENVYVVAVGKAAWKMAHTCQEIFGSHIRKGIILTKYGHSKQNLENFEIIEAGHPIPDNNSILGTQKIIDMVKELTEKDNIIFLLRTAYLTLVFLNTSFNKVNILLCSVTTDTRRSTSI